MALQHHGKSHRDGQIQEKLHACEYAPNPADNELGSSFVSFGFQDGRCKLTSSNSLVQWSSFKQKEIQAPHFCCKASVCPVSWQGAMIVLFLFAGAAC